MPHRASVTAQHWWSRLTSTHGWAPTHQALAQRFPWRCISTVLALEPLSSRVARPLTWYAVFGCTCTWYAVRCIRLYLIRSTLYSAVPVPGTLCAAFGSTVHGRGHQATVPCRGSAPPTASSHSHRGDRASACCCLSAPTTRVQRAAHYPDHRVAARSGTLHSTSQTPSANACSEMQRAATPRGTLDPRHPPPRPPQARQPHAVRQLTRSSGRGRTLPGHGRRKGRAGCGGRMPMRTGSGDGC